MNSERYRLISSCIYVEKLQYLYHGNDRKYCLDNDRFYSYTGYNGDRMEDRNAKRQKMISGSKPNAMEQVGAQ